ncbi:MAG TPA: DUF1800 domain-containing protein [Pirellulales bacterium]|nr:DUF1800 domain-containing protein [Pirellulales bacterium]
MTTTGLWREFVPGPSDPWDLAKVAHLHRRAGFFANRSELARDVEAGPAASVARFFEPPVPSDDERRILDSLRKGAVSGSDAERLKAWWLYQIFFGANPLGEKMTLFWHGHFATSNQKVNSLRLMSRQNQLLRRHAVGNVRELVGELVGDPAMLIWLDGASSKREKPNENFARELWELFTLGPGHYTEDDIREAARAFSGWRESYDREDSQTRAFRLDESYVDDGAKTILGRMGNWRADDVVRITFEQPATAEFLCRKLYRYFVSEAAEPDAQLIAPLAKQLRGNDYALRPTLETILRSQHFYSAAVRRQRVSSPVEYSVGLLRALAAPRTDVRLLALALACAQQGQDLFYPPNVKGWDGGRRWLNSATLAARTNWATDVIWGNPELRMPPYDPARWGNVSDTERPIETLIGVLLQDDIEPRALALIEETGAGDKPDDLRRALRLIVRCPEFQLV